jgi:hypothetical protein
LRLPDLEQKTYWLQKEEAWVQDDSRMYQD